MTEQEWQDMTEQEQFQAYNDVETEILTLAEQVADLRKKLYLLRKILKWKGTTE